MHHEKNTCDCPPFSYFPLPDKYDLFWPCLSSFSFTSSLEEAEEASQGGNRSRTLSLETENGGPYPKASRKKLGDALNKLHNFHYYSWTNKTQCKKWLFLIILTTQCERTSYGVCLIFHLGEYKNKFHRTTLNEGRENKDISWLN